MNADTNPTLPLAFDVAWMVLVLLWLGLVAIAWVSIFRAEHERGGAKFWWCMFVLAVPIFGSLIWFWVRPRPS